MQDICALTNLQENTIIKITNIGNSFSTLFDEFVQKGYLFSIMGDILRIKSIGEELLRFGEDTPDVLSANRFNEYYSSRINAERYEAFTKYNRILDYYDVRITQEEEYNKIKDTINGVIADMAEQSFKERIQKLRETRKGDKNGTNRKKEE